MATFLLTWELGEGLGHLVNLRPIVEGLTDRGHKVVLALRNLLRVRTVFSQRVTCLQAPFALRRVSETTPTLSYAQVLYDVGFGQSAELAALAQAWRDMFALVNPDVIVFDHSPTALLAARGLRAKRVLLGTGFFCPLDESPLPCLQPWLHPDAEKLAGIEQAVLASANGQLAAWNEPPLTRITQLYYPADEHLLVTFPELDHYSGRTGAHYRGAWPSGVGKAPRWPPQAGKRIYAYLKPFPALEALLGELARLGLPTIIYCDGIDEAVRDRWAAPNLTFETEPLDLAQVGRECDAAITNAGHGTVVALLRAGKPLLAIPLHLEQLLLTQGLVRQGLALGASADNAEQIALRLRELLADTQASARARQFAAKYASYDPARQIEMILDRLEALASTA